MILKFKNEHIFYALETIWNDVNFDYKFKTHINQLVSNNPDKDFIQDVEVSKEIVIDIYKACSRQPEGLAASINKSIKTALAPQLAALSNSGDVENNGAIPNEACSIQIAILQMDADDLEAREALILKGMNKILA